MKVLNKPKKPFIVALDEKETLDTCGACCTFNWHMLKQMIDKRIHVLQKSRKRGVRKAYAGDEVVKFSVAEDGITVYYKKIHSVGEGHELYKELILE